MKSISADPFKFSIRSALIPLLGLALLTGCSARTQLKVGKTAGGEVVEAEGLSAMTNDLIGVKRAALSDAFKVATEKVVGVFISGRTMVDKAITIQQNILTKTSGYIKKHDILKEGQGPDGLYHMKIRALVSYQQVENDLKGLDLIQSPVVGNPRIAILLDETVEGSDAQTTACSDALSQALISKGYKVVDRSELAAIRVAEATKELLSGDIEKALKPIIQKLDAEVVITGKASAKFLTDQGLGGMVSFRGSLNAKALKAQTGEILDTLAVQGSAIDVVKDVAGQKALAKLGRDAGNQFSENIAKEMAKRSTVVVTVKGLPDINRLSDIKEVLANTPGVESLYMRSFSQGNAEMEVKVKSASSSSIAESVSAIRTMKVQVTGQTADSVAIQVQP